MKRTRTDDSGASAVEMAIIAPSLLLLIFFVVQVSLWFYGRSVALSAAREGVSRLRLAQTEEVFKASYPGVNDSVKRYASTIGSGALNNPRVNSVYGPDSVTVTVSGTTISLIPFATFTVTQKAHGRIERFGN